jgi:hypothetical protein
MLIITKKVGGGNPSNDIRENRGLANRMWQFSYFLAFAIEHKVILINFSFADHAEHFIGTRKNLFSSYPHCKLPFKIKIYWLNRMFYLMIWLKKIAKGLRRRIPKFNNIFFFISVTGDHFLDLDKKKNYDLITKNCIVFIEGWKIRCNKTLIKHNEEIKKFFAPRKCYLVNISKIIEPIKREYDLVIGLHIRRGDYKEYLPDLYFTPEEYIYFLKKIEHYFCNRYNIAVIICSDEEIDKDLFNKNNYYFSTGHFVEDMYILSECDYIFGVSSTFSLWASFYGEVPLFMIENKNFKIEEADFKVFHSL